MKILHLTYSLLLTSTCCFAITLETWSSINLGEHTEPYDYYTRYYSSSDFLGTDYYPTFTDSIHELGNFSIGGSRSLEILSEINEPNASNGSVSFGLGKYYNPDNGFGYLEYSSPINPEMKSSLSFVYDGDSSPGLTNFNGLGCLDLTSDGATAFDMLGNADQESLEIKITVFDGRDLNGTLYVSSTVTKDLGNLFGSNTTPENFNFPFSSFIGSGNQETFSCVGAIMIEITSPFSNGIDWVLQSITSNGFCSQVPQKSELIADDCNVCNGTNSDKDRCDVCYGDGLSCCTSVNQKDLLQEIDNRGYVSSGFVRSLSNIVKKIAKKQENPKIRKKLLKKAKLYRNEGENAAYASWLAIWAFDSDTFNCGDVDGSCTTTFFTQEETNYLTEHGRLSKAMKPLFKLIKKHGSIANKKKAKNIKKRFIKNEAETMSLFSTVVKTTETCS